MIISGAVKGKNKAMIEDDIGKQADQVVEQIRDKACQEPDSGGQERNNTIRNCAGSASAALFSLNPASRDRWTASFVTHCTGAVCGPVLDFRHI